MPFILCGMHPQLRIYFDFVWPLFWPWLVWNLLRVAQWHTETGRDALMAVDRFGNIRFVRMSDPPPPDDLYAYEAPRVPRWERPALAGGLPVGVQPLLPGEKGLGMRGREAAAGTAHAEMTSPLTPAPLPGERGLPVRGPP